MKQKIVYPNPVVFHQAKYASGSAVALFCFAGARLGRGSGRLVHVRFVWSPMNDKEG